MNEHSEHPQYARWWVGGWLAPLLVAFITLAWCLLIYFLIGDRPTDWKYGTTPFVPAKSVFTSRAPRPGARVPNQVALPKRAAGGSNAKP